MVKNIYGIIIFITAWPYRLGFLTFMDKLNIIKNSIEQIRTAIGEPCDHIETLPEKINELVEDASKVGYSTVFVFSNEENPNKPTGNLYENGIVSDLDDNWSQTKIEDSGKVWMSFSLFKQSGGQVSDWVTPILITGKDGKDAFTPQFKIEDGFWYIQYSENGEWVKVGQATGAPGKDGADGKDGIQGPQGEPGKDGVDGAPGQDGTDGEDGKDGADGKDGVDGEPGRGIVSVEKLFAVNNDPNDNPTEGWTTIENVSTSSTNRYMWCKETTTFTSGDPTVIHYIVAIEGEPGANGTGNDAPIIYPAGVWDNEKEYESTDDKVPYVYYLLTDENGDPTEESGYYILQEGLGKYTSNITPDLDSNWKKMESFEAIYSDIGLFNQALVGKWVFHGVYMFSQDGVDASGNPKKYSDFTDPKEAIANGTFKPNVLFNSVTGEMSGNNVTINNGSLTFDSNSFRMESGGQRKVSIYNGELTVKTTMAKANSGSVTQSSSSSTYIPTGSEGSYSLIFGASTEFLGTNSSLSLSKFSWDPITITSENGDVNWKSALTIKADLYLGSELLHTKTTTTSPGGSGFIDLSEFNSKIDVKLNPGVYSVEIKLSGTAVYAENSKYGNASCSCSGTLDWNYDSHEETIIGSNGVCVINNNGLSWLGNYFETMQGLVGLRVSSNGIEYTKDGGGVWSSLV